jgi:hypothetical protein
MNQLKNIVQTIKSQSAVTYYHTLFALGLGLIATGGLILDDRTLMGVNVWLKPWKFCVSTAIFVASVGYFTHYYKYSQRKKSIINHITAWTLSIELLIIVAQGARGVKSHYNMSTPLDGVLFGAMGILVGINVLTMVLFFIDSLRNTANANRIMHIALILGWTSILVGSYVGGQMIAQMSHTVGLADGGSGIPMVNWSSLAGDLRVAHFFGIHGLQVLPIVAYLAVQKWGESIQAATVTGLVSLTYLGLIAGTFYQAKQGIALLALSL